MPYVDQVTREGLDAGSPPTNVGELTYLIYAALLRGHPESKGALAGHIQADVDAFIRANGKRYATLNGVVGSLECARREYIRRRLRNVSHAPPLMALEDYLTEFYGAVVAPYEDDKIEENGDVTA